MPDIGTSPCPPTKSRDPKNTRVGVIGVIQRGPQFLAIRRGAQVRKPGKICFPGGTLIAGEKESETVVRELREELGVQVRPITRIHRSETAWGTQLFWWSCQLESRPTFTLHPVEVAEIRWATLEELLAHPDLLESNHSFLERFRGGDLIPDGPPLGD